MTSLGASSRSSLFPHLSSPLRLTRLTHLSTALAYVLSASLKPEYLDSADVALDELLSDPDILVRPLRPYLLSFLAFSLTRRPCTRSTARQKGNLSYSLAQARLRATKEGGRHEGHRRRFRRPFIKLLRLLLPLEAYSPHVTQHLQPSSLSLRTTSSRRRQWIASCERRCIQRALGGKSAFLILFMPLTRSLTTLYLVLSRVVTISVLQSLLLSLLKLRPDDGHLNSTTKVLLSISIYAKGEENVERGCRDVRAAFDTVQRWPSFNPEAAACAAYQTVRPFPLQISSRSCADSC